MPDPVSLLPMLSGRPKVGDEVDTPIGKGKIDRFDKGIAVILVSDGWGTIEHRIAAKSVIANPHYHDTLA